MGVIGYLTNIVFGVMIFNSELSFIKGSSLYPRFVREIIILFLYINKT